MGIVKSVLYSVSQRRFLSFFKKQTIFPYYHIVRDDKVRHIQNLYPYKSIEQFKRDVALLKKNYVPLNPKDLIEGKLPDNSFLLTFDDGLSEIYNIIFPILKQAEINAVFFINPSFVDNHESLYKHDISVIISHIKELGLNDAKLAGLGEIFSTRFSSAAAFSTYLKQIKFSQRQLVSQVSTLLEIDIDNYRNEYKPYITKQQIQEMIDAGFYFGGHTLSHPPLVQLDFESQKREILDSVDWLKQNFGLTYSMFAFPFSDKNMSRKLIDTMLDYDPNMLIFGNAGIKKDVSPRIIQRFSLENPFKSPERVIVTENLYKLFNQLIGKFHIKRK